MTALAPGLIIAETYQLTALIGRGGMGVVWQARHLRLPRDVAIKFMRLDDEAGSRAFARFRHEAEIVARLGHPGIVGVLDFNVMGGVGPYIVMELLTGENLRARLLRGPLPPTDALAVVQHIAPALEAAHRHGVVHRDLKPDNLFLSAGDPRFTKVLDFGISKLGGSETVRTHKAAVLGTPRYMAPEQAVGAEDIDQRVDVFALGAIVYEMLTGERAFTGATLAEITYQIVHGAPPPLADRAPWLPASVVAAVAQALAKNREDRPRDVPSFAALLADLATTAPGAGAAGKTAAPPGASPSPAPLAPGATMPDETARARPQRPTRRPTRWLVAGLVLAAAAALVVVWSTTSTPPRAEPAPHAARPRHDAGVEPEDPRLGFTLAPPVLDARLPGWGFGPAASGRPDAGGDAAHAATPGPTLPRRAAVPAPRAISRSPADAGLVVVADAAPAPRPVAVVPAQDAGVATVKRPFPAPAWDAWSSAMERQLAKSFRACYQAIDKAEPDLREIDVKLYLGLGPTGRLVRGSVALNDVVIATDEGDRVRRPLRSYDSRTMDDCAEDVLRTDALPAAPGEHQGYWFIELHYDPKPFTPFPR